MTKLNLEEKAQSIDCVNRIREEFGKQFDAYVTVKLMQNYKATIFQKKRKVVIGRGQYADANIPFVQIDWPLEFEDRLYSTYDCGYVNMKYISTGNMVIYSQTKLEEQVEIDIIV